LFFEDAAQAASAHYDADVSTIDEVKTLLTDGYGLTVVSELAIQNGVQVATREGPKINVFETGKCVPNGKASI
jgi:hypothetical protein